MLCRLKCIVELQASDPSFDEVKIIMKSSEGIIAR